MGRGYGDGFSLPRQTKRSGEHCEPAPPVGSGAEPRPKTNLEHIKLHRTPVVEGKSGIL